MRELSKVRDNKETVINEYSSLFVITVLTSILTTLVYIIFIYTKYYGQETYIACIVLSFNLLNTIFYTEWLNEALENYKFITLKTILVRLVYVVLLITLVKTSDNLLEYLFLLVLSNFLNNIISFIYIKRKIKFNFRNIKILKHFKPMFFVVILSNAGILYSQLDRVMLGEYISKEAVAFYTVAQNISNMVNTLLLTVIHVTIPRLSNYSSNNKKNKYNILLNKICGVYFLIMFPSAILMLVLSKEIVLIYGGIEYIIAAPILAIFSIYIITLGYESILSNQVMYVNNKEKQQVKFVFICGGINLISNVFLLKIEKFSGVTAIITTMLSNFTLVILQHIYIKYKMNIKFNIFSGERTKYLYVACIYIPIAFIIKNIINSSILIILLVTIIGSILYIIILIIIKDENLITITSMVKNKIKKL